MQKHDPIPRPRNLGSSPLTQKMANKLPLKNTSSNPRAMPLHRNGTAPTPPSSDSDTPEHPSAANPSLVQLARHAALAREAAGWQRFWATYALRLGALTLLRVRMPKAFDRVWSYRLARLLDQELGWRVVHFDEERRPHADGAGVVHVERDGLCGARGFGGGGSGRISGLGRGCWVKGGTGCLCWVNGRTRMR